MIDQVVVMFDQVIRQVPDDLSDPLLLRVRIGDQVVLKASVNYVGRTSMEVGVRVTREDPYGGNSRLATSAHLTFVALDENKKPVPAIRQRGNEKWGLAAAEPLPIPTTGECIIESSGRHIGLPLRKSP